MTIEAFASEFKPTIWHRLGFGHAYVAPWGDEPHPWGKEFSEVTEERGSDGLLLTSLTTETRVHFDWLDRLRILVTGRVHVFVRTRSEHDPGRADSRSAVRVMGLGW